MSKGGTGKPKVVLLVLGMVALVWPAAASADELSDLKQELQQQKKRTAELEDRLSQLESRQRLEERSLGEKIEKVEAQVEEAPSEPAIPKALEWASRMQWSGDFRYRYEYIDDATRTEDRHRNRIRARLGMKAEVNDEWDVGLRIASGTADPVSTNQTLDEAFSRKPIWLDRAYVDYHPDWMQGLNAVAGKVSNPFYAVGENQLIWDSDLSPEGGAIGYEWTLNEQTSVHLNGGGFWVAEESASTDASLWGIQAYVKHQIGNPTYVLAGAGFFDYGNIQGHGSFAGEWDDDHDLFGNTSLAGDPNAFGSDFDLFELFAEFATEIGKTPVSVWGDWVKNTVAVSGEDTGWLVGGRINKAKAPGTWEFSYDYRDIELDAVVGQFNDSDFIGGGTGGKGHRFGLAYAIAKNTQAALTYFATEYDGRKSNADYDRLQADIKVKF